MATLRDAAKALATLTSPALKKKSKGKTTGEIYSIVHELYTKEGYVPISRLEDLKYSSYMLNVLTGKEGSKQINTILEWANTRGIKASTRNPFDIVRVILDTMFDTCLYGSVEYNGLLNIGILKTKSLTLTYRGLCDLVKGLSEFAATQHLNDYLLHMGELFTELFTSYTGIKIHSLLDALRVDPDKFEKFRVHITAKFFPMAKAYLTMLYLFKYKWSIREIVSTERSEGGFRAKKAIDPTYLGRITSELLDSMMGHYYDETALHAYDGILRAYFTVFQEFNNDVESGSEFNYIESHPVMSKYVDELKSILKEVTPQIRSHLERRGIVRLGEVKQDVKDYLLTLFYLSKESDRMGYVPISEIRNYDWEKLLIRNSLVRR